MADVRQPLATRAALEEEAGLRASGNSALADLLAAEAVARAAADDLRALLTDPRFTDARPPTGGAGGVLSGGYPDPGFAVDMAEQSELQTEITTRANADTALSGAVVAAQADIDGHQLDLANPHAVTKAQVGLANVTNDAQETPAGAQSKVDAAIAALLDSAPGTLDTLNELAAALGDDPNFATSLTDALALKAPIASPTFTGTVTLPGDPGSALVAAPKQYVDAAIDALTGLSPRFNIVDYGASVLSIDNQVAIQAARDAAEAAGGGCVTGPAGEFVTSPVAWKSNIDYEAPLGHILKQKAGTTGSLIYNDYLGTPVNGARLAGFQIDGNKTNCPDGRCGVELYGADITCDHLALRHTARACVILGADEARKAGGAGRHKILDCWGHNPGFSGEFWGAFAFTGGDDCRMSRNLATTTDGFMSYAFDAEPNPTWTVRRVRFEDNVGLGGVLAVNAGVETATVIGNYIDAATAAGNGPAIKVVGVTGKVLVHNNDAIGPNHTSPALSLDTLTDPEVTENRLYGMGVSQNTYPDNVGILLDDISGGWVSRNSLKAAAATHASTNAGIKESGTTAGVAYGLNHFKNITVKGKSTTQLEGKLEVTAQAAADVVGVLRGFTGQTGDIFQAQDPAGAVLARITALGRVNLGSQVSGAGVVVGDPSAAPTGLGSNVGLDVYADFNATATALAYLNRSTGTTSGLGMVWGLADSAGTMKRAMQLRAEKVGIWSSADVNTQNGKYTVRLLKNGVDTLALSLDSSGVLLPAGGLELANVPLIAGSGAGTKIGTATTQKLGFWNQTPVTQPAGVADATGGATVDTEARAAINAVIARLEACGILATV